MIATIFATFVDLFVPLFSVLVLVRVILSYFVNPSNGLMIWLLNLTEPLIGLVRRVLPKSTIGLDFAPLVTLFLLQGLQYLVDGLIHP